MERSKFLWMTILGSLFSISNSYLTPKVQFDFVPENHENWNKLDHDDCGFSLKNRIIGGTNAQLGQYPWLVRMGRIRKQGSASYISFPCGGAIVNRYYILTAAHCFLQAKTFPNIVRVGEYNLDTNPDCVDGFCAPMVQDINLVECYVPHHFYPKLMENDICLCLLEEPIKFSELVSPICMLPHKVAIKNVTGLMAEVAGWGLTDFYSKSTPRILQTVQLQIVGNRSCKMYKQKHKNFPENIICAGNERGRDSCAGDSGGPLMVPLTEDGPRRYYALGVVSYGPEKCAEDPVPAVYTKVAQYQSWLLDLITMS